jgi:hypothetical protein
LIGNEPPAKLFLDSLPAFFWAKSSADAGPDAAFDGPGVEVDWAACELPLAGTERGEKEGTSLTGMVISSAATEVESLDKVEAVFEGFWAVRRVELASSERGGMIGFVSESPILDAVVRSLFLRLLMTCPRAH